MRAVDGLTAELVADAPDHDGRALTAAAAVGELGGLEYGIWEMAEGVTHDVEADEVFVVIAGRGSVRFASGELLELGPGVVVRLHEGERTEWTVTSTLRKMYFA